MCKVQDVQNSWPLLEVPVLRIFEDYNIDAHAVYLPWRMIPQLHFRAADPALNAELPRHHTG